MTCISFDTYYDSYLFECTGHTGYAAAGEDLLCSAVSILCYTLKAYLCDAADEGRVRRLSDDFSPGSVRIDFELADDDSSVMEGVLAILGGFRLLEEAYPDYIEANV